MRNPLPLAHYDLPDEAVRGRFEWAVRRGNQLWLWPEVAPADWQDALFRIEAATRQVLAGGRATLAGPAEALGIAAFTSGMGPLLGYWLEQGTIEADEDVAAVLELHYRHNSIRMAKLAGEATCAVECLARHGVGVTILKGMDTAFTYFPTPGTRPLADIDLLIRPDDEAIAAEALAALGYRAGPRPQPPAARSWRKPSSPDQPRSLSLTHQDDPWCIDLHTSLNRRYSAGAPLIRLDAAYDRDLARPWALSAAGRTLPPPALVLHLACHAGCGLSSLTMLRLTELALVLRAARERGEALCDEFVLLGRRSETLSSAYAALAMLSLLVPDLVPPAVLSECRERAPAAVRQVVEALRPATAQRLVRCSVRERFMWAGSPAGALRQLGHELFPVGTAGKNTWFYKARFWRLVRRTVSIGAGAQP